MFGGCAHVDPNASRSAHRTHHLDSSPNNGVPSSQPRSLRVDAVCKVCGALRTKGLRVPSPQLVQEECETDRGDASRENARRRQLLACLCGTALYCSAKCQRLDWPHHINECNAAPQHHQHHYGANRQQERRELAQQHAASFSGGVARRSAAPPRSFTSHSSPSLLMGILGSSVPLGCGWCSAVPPSTAARPALLLCPCLRVGYCDVRCQSRHWPSHGLVCAYRLAAKEERERERERRSEGLAFRLKRWPDIIGISSAQTAVTMVALSRPLADADLEEAARREEREALSIEESLARDSIAALEIEEWGSTMRIIAEELAALIKALQTNERRARGLIVAAFTQYAERMMGKSRKLVARYVTLRRREAAARLAEQQQSLLV